MPWKTGIKTVLRDQNVQLLVKHTRDVRVPKGFPPSPCIGSLALALSASKQGSKPGISFTHREERNSFHTTVPSPKHPKDRPRQDTLPAALK